MINVGEHITIDFLGVKKDYSPEFYEKVIYKIAKAAKVEILNVASHRFEPQGFTFPHVKKSKLITPLSGKV